MIQENFKVACKTDGLDGAKSIVGEGLLRVNSGRAYFQGLSDASDEEGLDFG